MNTNLAIEILGFGGILPATVSIATVFLLRRVSPRNVSGRYAAAVGFALAFFVGYVLLPSPAALVPARHWHWLPYLGIGAAIIGPVGLATGVSKPESWLLHFLLAIVAAWLLVPTWSSLQPPRSVYIPILIGYFFLLTAFLTPLPARLPGRLFPTLLFVVSACVATLIAAFVSVSYGRIAGVAAAATFGSLVTSGLHNDDENTGLLPAYVVVVGGAAFVGCVEPQPPLIGILCLPATPLALWVFMLRPLNRLEGVAASAARTTTVLVPLAIAVIWVVISANRTT